MNEAPACIFFQCLQSPQSDNLVELGIYFLTVISIVGRISDYRRHNCGTTAAQLRHNCETTAKQLRHN